MSSTDALTLHYRMETARPAAAPRLERATSLLFIGFLLLTFIGTHPLQTGSVDQRADGSILDRIVVFSLFGLALSVIWMARDVALRTITRNVGRIVFLDVPVLFMDNCIIGQRLDCFVPSGMNGFIFRRSHRKEFRQTYFKTSGNVCIL